jgi:cell division protein FtsZ
MGYINAFMNKFNPDEVDVIWGYAIDNSLGKEVKVTLLATGFTVEDITRSEFTRSEEEEERLRKEQQEQDLIGRYYGEVDRRGRPTFVVLEDDELDDDLLIALLEDHSPLSRPSKLIPSSRKPAATSA